MKADPSYDIPTKSSGAAQWTEWFDELNSNFGLKIARQLWLSAWSTRGSDAANTTDLRSYMGKYGVKITTGVLGSIEDVSLSAVDTISSFMNMGKIATYVIGGILIVGLGGLMYQVVRKPETLGTIAKAVAV